MDTPEILSLIVGGIAALLIAVADFRNRNVRLVPLLMLLGAGIAFQIIRDAPSFWSNWGINAAVVTGILLLAMLTLRILGNSGFINKQIGLGDVILFYAMAAWFPPAGFVLYFSSGLMLSLSGVLVAMLTNRYPRELPMPLAGLMASYSLIFMPIFLCYELEIVQAFEAGW